jgi:SAM-dependent methyltransferase
MSDARFQSALERLQRKGSTDRFLDVGCFVGQIARAFAFSGVDTEKLYGTDLEQAYLDLGFDLFRDEHKMRREHFIAGDMLQEPRDPRLDAFVGKITLINASSFFHLFDLPQQIKAAKRCVEFLDPDAQDAMIFGRMTGRADPGGMVQGPGGSKLFLHSAESWAQLWREVGESTGTVWLTEYELIDDVEFETVNQKFTEAGVKRSRFGAYRIK